MKREVNGAHCFKKLTVQRVNYAKLMGSFEKWSQSLRKERWRDKEDSLPSQCTEVLDSRLKEGFFFVPGSCPKEPSKSKLEGLTL